jgi:hypothetical protein
MVESTFVPSSRAHYGPRITRTGAGIPGDPLNVSNIGSQDDLVSELLEAGWYPADQITLKSSFSL